MDGARGIFSFLSFSFLISFRFRTFHFVFLPLCHNIKVLQGVDYDEKADVYSFGIVLCELITRRKATDDLPRSHTDFSLDVSKLMPLVPEDCPPGLINLTISCVAYDPHARPSFKEITRTLKALLSSLTPTTTSHPRPSSYSLLCSSTGAPLNNPSPSTMSPMQQHMHQQHKLQKERQQQKEAQLKEQQVHVTSHNGSNPKENVRTGRPHAATSPTPYLGQTTHNHNNNNNSNNNHYQNGFGNHWTNEGEGFVNVTGGSPSPSRAVVWSDVSPQLSLLFLTYPFNFFDVPTELGKRQRTGDQSQYGSIVCFQPVESCS